MKTPELTLLHSENIAAEMAFGQLALRPDVDALEALNDRLGLKTPDAMTVALVYPGDQMLFPSTETADDPAEADQASVGMGDFSMFADKPLPVVIRELTEQDILASFASSLMARNRSSKQMRVLTRGATAIMTEMGISTIGSTMQGPGLNWWLLGIPAAIITAGGIWQWSRNLQNRPPVTPDLVGLESPIRLIEQ